MNAFDHLTSLQLRLGDSADAVGAEVGVASLNTPQATQVLVALLLPFGDEILVGDRLVDAVIVQLATDGFAAVIQVVDVARFLIVDFEHRPQRLHNPLALVRVTFRLPHLLV